MFRLCRIYVSLDVSQSYGPPRVTGITLPFFFSILLDIDETGAGAYPASYAVGTLGGSFLGVKRLGREDDHSLHVVPKSRMVELYLQPHTSS
jgi:hypothetical protein